jgi:capsular polysaccharide biosynthesis protein
MPLEEEVRLEKYFTSKGYEIIDPEDLSFYEQINYYYNATHIASIRGSGLFNTIFCQEDANIFILDTAQPYEFAYYDICKLSTQNVYEIPFTLRFKKFMQDSLFSVNNITGILDSHYADMI